MRAVDAQKLALTFVELADSLVADFDVVELLQTLVDRCVELLGAGAAGIALVQNGHDLRLVVSSSDRAQLLELLQVQNDEGPALDCYHSGAPVPVTALDEYATTWPTFTPIAAAQGFGTVMALPMRCRGDVLGALSLFGSGQHPPVRDEDIVIAQAMADAASIAILHDRRAQARDVLTEQLEEALISRVTIEQAKGRISAALDIDPNEAFRRLRRRARNTRRRLTDVAEQAIHGDCSEFATFAPGTAPGPRE